MAAQGAGPVHQSEGDSLSALRGGTKAQLAGEQLGVSLGMWLPRENVLLGQAEGFVIPLAMRGTDVTVCRTAQLISSSHVGPEVWPPQVPSPGPQCTAAPGTS